MNELIKKLESILAFERKNDFPNIHPATCSMIAEAISRHETDKAVPSESEHGFLLYLSNCLRAAESVDPMSNHADTLRSVYAEYIKHRRSHPTPSTTEPLAVLADRKGLRVHPMNNYHNVFWTIEITTPMNDIVKIVTGQPYAAAEAEAKLYLTALPDVKEEK